MELTINDVEFFKVYRASQAGPEGPLDWRSMRRTVADLYRRAEVTLNPWSPEDVTLLRAIGDPKGMVTGIRNRDLVAALYKDATQDAVEKRRRSARVTRLLRILRGHGLLQKVPKTHRYQVNETARAAIAALIA